MRIFNGVPFCCGFWLVLLILVLVGGQVLWALYMIFYLYKVEMDSPGNDIDDFEECVSNIARKTTQQVQNATPKRSFS